MKTKAIQQKLHYLTRQLSKLAKEQRLIKKAVMVLMNIKLRKIARRSDDKVATASENTSHQQEEASVTTTVDDAAEKGNRTRKSKRSSLPTVEAASSKKQRIEPTTSAGDLYLLPAAATYAAERQEEEELCEEVVEQRYSPEQYNDNNNTLNALERIKLLSIKSMVETSASIAKTTRRSYKHTVKEDLRHWKAMNKFQEQHHRLAVAERAYVVRWMEEMERNGYYPKPPMSSCVSNYHPPPPLSTGPPSHISQTSGTCYNHPQQLQQEAMMYHTYSR